MGIKAKKNSVVVELNPRIYSQLSINQAIEDFKESCDIKTSEQGIELKPKDKEDLTIVGYEFYNYVLGLMKNGN